MNPDLLVLRMKPLGLCSGTWQGALGWIANLLHFLPEQDFLVAGIWLLPPRIGKGSLEEHPGFFRMKQGGLSEALSDQGCIPLIPKLI